jgi:[ribosomal protein S18]-alanine N-acetyltransferase
VISPPRSFSEDDCATPDGAFIRKMRAADVDAVFALERVTAEAPHWASSEYESIFSDQPEGASLARVALISELGGKVVGFAVVRLLHVPASSGRPEMVDSELESIVVAPALRGRGIGLRLMNAILELAGSRGSERLELEVRASNEKAIRLYARAGMMPQGRRPGYYSDPPDDALLMARDLNPAK